MYGSGADDVTRICRSLSSFAHVCAKLLTAALLALNTPKPGIPFIVHMEAFRTTAAPSGSNGRAFCMQKNTPLTLAETGVELTFRYLFNREVFRRAGIRE